MLRIDAVRKQIDASGSAMPPEEVLISQVLERLIQENIQYQALLQKDLQDAQLKESKEGRDLQIYQNEAQ